MRKNSGRGQPLGEPRDPERAALIRRIAELCATPLVPRGTDAVATTNRIGDVRAVLFDVYGTLLISACGDVGASVEDAEAVSLTQALDAVGAEGDLTLAGECGANLLRDAIHADHARLRQRGVEYPEVEIRSLWRRVVQALVDDDTLHPDSIDVDVNALAVEYECRVNPTWPAPGTRELLAGLKARALPLGIVSNAQFFTPLLFPALYERSVKKLGFDPRLCAWSYRHQEAKPALDFFTRALEPLREIYQIQPQNVLFVGNDMLKDIWVARQSGCLTALYAGDQRSLRWRRDDERCANLKPDAVVTELRALLELL